MIDLVYTIRKPDIPGYYWLAQKQGDCVLEMVVEVYPQLGGMFADYPMVVDNVERIFEINVNYIEGMWAGPLPRASLPVDAYVKEV
jgi:hypothetical protein